jgi:hypothetical protein
MTDVASEMTTTHYAACEVVGVFPTTAALEAAVEQLGIAGIDRAAISVLGIDAQRSGQVDTLFRSARAISDDPAARQAAFVSHATRTEGEAIAIGFPVYIGGFAGAWAVAAAGGALIVAIGATAAGGLLGAGLGALLYRAVARNHVSTIETQLASGGLIVWVSTTDQAAADLATLVLKRCGGASVHTHTIDRHWGTADVPLADLQPDPFL